MRLFRLLAPGACALLLLLPGCAPSTRSGTALGEPEPVPGTFSVMTYNVMRYTLDDRDGDGQEDDPKPPEEVAALIRVIRRANPDVLALQEIGSESLFIALAERLAQAGAEYPHRDFLPSPHTNLNLAVLSRLPIVGRYPITDEFYTIGDEVLPVQRGFQVLDLQAAPDYRFRLVNVHLKSKVFNVSGQTEMRRNEARLLNKNVRAFLRADTNLNLLVLGDFNDQFNSAALREARGRELEDLRPRDRFGDLWTHYWDDEETYARIDYLLVSAGMQREVLVTHTRVVRDEEAPNASDHRPVMGVFFARDR